MVWSSMTVPTVRRSCTAIAEPPTTAAAQPDSIVAASIRATEFRSSVPGIGGVAPCPILSIIGSCLSREPRRGSRNCG